MEFGDTSPWDGVFFFKLLWVFVLVIVVLAIVTTVLANKATAGLFRAYTDSNGQVLAEYLAPSLADYYAQNYTWHGVRGLLQVPPTDNTSSSPPILPTPTAVPQSFSVTPPTPAPASPGMGPRRMRRGMMSGMGSGNTDPGVAPTSTWQSMGPGTGKLVRNQ